MKYSIEKLKIAQLLSQQIDKSLLKEIESRASYVDTDKSLNECMTSVDCILNIATEAEGAGNIRLANLADELYKQVEKFNYIQIAKV